MIWLPCDDDEDRPEYYDEYYDEYLEWLSLVECLDDYESRDK